MTDRVTGILRPLRRRLIFAGAVEAAAVGGLAGSLTAAMLMAGWILTGRFPFAATVFCALPILIGAILASCQRLRHSDRLIRWCVVVVFAGCGGGAVAMLLTGTHVSLPKNWLFAIAPASSIIMAAVTVIRGASLREVAIRVDIEANLDERLGTAWELSRAGDDSTFASAVRRQAVSAFVHGGAGGGTLARRWFWTRTRATAGALGLAAAAAALMLPWTPLESPSARRQRQWRQVGLDASESLRRIAALDARNVKSDPVIVPELRRLERLADALRTAGAKDAKQWRDDVAELEKVTERLRQALWTGQFEGEQADRVLRLVRALERRAVAMAGAVPERTQYARAGTRRSGAPSVSPPAGTSEGTAARFRPLTVYDPAYAAAALSHSAGATEDGTGQNPGGQVPYDRAWAAARGRAAETAGKESLPAEYRQLVRDFFDVDRRR